MRDEKRKERREKQLSFSIHSIPFDLIVLTLSLPHSFPLLSSHTTFALSGALAYTYHSGGSLHAGGGGGSGGNGTGPLSSLLSSAPRRAHAARLAALWAAVAALSLLIVASHKHYSVDVLVAWWTVPCVWALLERRWTSGPRGRGALRRCPTCGGCGGGNGGDSPPPLGALSPASFKRVARAASAGGLSALEAGEGGGGGGSTHGGSGGGGGGASSSSREGTPPPPRERGRPPLAPHRAAEV